MGQQGATDDERAAARPFVLCADDYGLSPSVSRGILKLLDLGRISATGAMTNRPNWRTLAPDLKPFDGRADLGLHVNLTCGAPLGPMPTVAPRGELPPHPTIARLALVSAAARREIAGEIGRQAEAFAEAMGRPPDFIDGHQHVHVLPGVRGAILAAGARLQSPGFYVRDPADRPAAILARGVAAKAALVAITAAGFGAAARRVGLATNEGFSGVSDFDPRKDYGAEFAAALRMPGRAHLAMCHPGEIDEELRRADRVVETRVSELEFFAGARFPDVCAAANMRVARMRDVRAAPR